MKGQSNKSFIPSFASLLNTVRPETISKNEYCVTYLSHLIKHKLYYLRIYADVLDKLTEYLNTDKSSTVIVDFGAGNGLLGIFAKYCGFQKVYANDIDPAFLESSEHLSNQLHLSLDGFILGSIEQVHQYLATEKADAIIGTDVIEHIYDLDSFFHTLQRINPTVVTVFTTASNPHNFLKVRQLRKLQKQDEEIGYNGGSMDTVSHEGYFAMRKKIIEASFHELPPNVIAELAKVTRGLIKHDIIKAVAHFTISGELPIPGDEYNTCHPYTGSWTERILPLKTYHHLYRQNGFRLRTFSGFYNSSTSGRKRFINKLFNGITFFAGHFTAPYITLVGLQQKIPNRSIANEG